MNFWNKNTNSLNLFLININNTPNSLSLIKKNDNWDQIFNSFFYLKKSLFISFFVTNMIDIPICFKKSPSLKKSILNIPLLKFINLLIKKGKKEQIMKIFFKSLQLLLLEFKKEKKISFIFNKNFIYIYLFLNHTFLNLNSRVDIEKKNDLSFNNFFLNYEKYINTTFFIKNFILTQINKITPIFSYFIYNVDKNIKKYSRGKSGKYVFIWKYIAPYKRLFITMNWIIKDIKFNTSKLISKRLTQTFLNLILMLEKSFAWKSKIFTHNYVFKNFKKTLMTTLKTTL